MDPFVAVPDNMTEYDAPVFVFTTDKVPPEMVAFDFGLETTEYVEQFANTVDKFNEYEALERDTVELKGSIS